MHWAVRIEFMLLILFKLKADVSGEYDVSLQAILISLACVVAVPDLMEKLLWPGLYTAVVAFRAVDLSWVCDALSASSSARILDSLPALGVCV